MALSDANKILFQKVSNILNKIDKWRNETLSGLVRRYWPQFILPNYLTVLRIVIAFFVVSALISQNQSKLYVFFLYIIGLWLDLFDGVVARTLNKKTKFGGFLDPLADKLLNGAMAVYLLWPAHLIVLIFLFIPEVINILGSFFYISTQKPIDANIFGKAKMTLQSFGFLVIIFTSINLVSLAALWLAIMFSLISLILKAKEGLLINKNA